MALLLAVVVDREDYSRVDEIVEVGKGHLVLRLVLLEVVLEDLQPRPERRQHLLLGVDVIGLALDVEHVLDDVQRVLEPGHQLQVALVRVQVVDLGLLQLAEGHVAHHQQLHALVLDQRHEGQPELVALDLLEGEEDVVDVVVDHELLVELLAARLQPQALAVEEALELFIGLVEAAHQLVHIIPDDLLGDAVEVLNYPKQAQLLLDLLVPLRLEVGLDHRLVELVVLPPEGGNAEGLLH